MGRGVQYSELGTRLYGAIGMVGVRPAPPPSLSVGLFHFRPWDFLRHNPLFAATVIPNLLKEYAGLKAQ